LPLSVEMITHRPITGSRLNSAMPQTPLSLVLKIPLVL
jgi:hypothetical protein